MIRGRSLTCAWLVLIGGCASTGVGNPAPVPSLSLAIVDDTQDADAAGAAGVPDASGATSDAGAAGAAGASDPPDQELPQAAIQDAIVVLGELRFMPCDANQGSERVVPGPFIVDLKAKTTTPPIPTIDGTPGGFCGLDAPLAPARGSAALNGRSLFFDGTRADGTFFLVYANMKGTLRLRAAPNQSWLGSTTSPKFFWALRPRRWLAQSELDEADVMPYDDHLRAVVIDVDRHPALFLAIRTRLAGLSTLYADADGDGVFTDADRQAAVGQGLADAD